jgi:hypothetical protein
MYAQATGYQEAPATDLSFSYTEVTLKTTADNLDV